MTVKWFASGTGQWAAQMPGFLVDSIFLTVGCSSGLGDDVAAAVRSEICASGTLTSTSNRQLVQL